MSRCDTVDLVTHRRRLHHSALVVHGAEVAAQAEGMVASAPEDA
jgi:hypothetical protein